MGVGNGVPPYTVEYPESLREKIVRFRSVAAGQGRLAEYVAALRFIQDKLLYDPTRWGDPIKRWPHAKLTGYRKTHGLFIVFYAVHSERRYVVVRDMLILPPLDSGKPPF